MLRSVAVLTLVAALSPAMPAWASRIIVNPGPGTPVQDAINASGPGDVVKLNPGTYPEAITITKPLKVYGKDATIDAGCAVMTGVQISADAVSLRSLTVRGGNFYAIDATGRDRIVIDRVTVIPSCPNVEYGINVFQGSRMRIRNNTFSDPAGYGDAAIYIGGTLADADLRVERNTIIGPNVRGIIVEDSIDNPGRPIAVRVRKNEITGAGTGVWVFGSSGAEVLANEISNGTGPGIEMTMNSSGNLIKGNRLSGNTPDVLDSGSDNCWLHNVYTTGSVPPC